MAHTSSVKTMYETISCNSYKWTLCVNHHDGMQHLEVKTSKVNSALVLRIDSTLHPWLLQQSTLVFLLQEGSYRSGDTMNSYRSDSDDGNTIRHYKPPIALKSMEELCVQEALSCTHCEQPDVADWHDQLQFWIRVSIHFSTQTPYHSVSQRLVQ